MPNGRIGLIDYGQIKSLKQAQRKSMARMIIALADGKKEVSKGGRDGRREGEREGRQIKSLKQAQRKSMVRMIIALADGKKEVRRRREGEGEPSNLSSSKHPLTHGLIFSTPSLHSSFPPSLPACRR